MAKPSCLSLSFLLELLLLVLPLLLIVLLMVLLLHVRETRKAPRELVKKVQPLLALPLRVDGAGHFAVGWCT